MVISNQFLLVNGGLESPILQMCVDLFLPAQGADPKVSVHAPESVIAIYVVRFMDSYTEVASFPVPLFSHAGKGLVQTVCTCVSLSPEFWGSRFFCNLFTQNDALKWTWS